MRIIAVVTALLALCACSAEPRACTLIGSRPGIGLDVELPGATSAAVEICWDGTCTEPAVRLTPATSHGPQTCTGTSPTDTCGVSVVPTGGLTGFADVANLPAKAVTVTLVLTDATGAVVLDETTTATPKMVYPNGEACGGGGAQTGLVVSAAGVVTERA
ncbi:hypothetical protein [Umezawaea sp.]|uniref:hypothetical protein n=1 Tax=Umezawaea sp. TaxID=1955258 RepID=UPI002ED004B8